MMPRLSTHMHATHRSITDCWSRWMEGWAVVGGGGGNWGERGSTTSVVTILGVTRGVVDAPWCSTVIFKPEVVVASLAC